MWKICYIIYMAERHSASTRQHDLQQRWRRKKVYVQYIWALGGWSLVMPCSNNWYILLTYPKIWKTRATDTWWSVKSSFVVGLQRWLIWTTWCNCGGWGMRLVVFTHISTLPLTSFHPFLTHQMTHSCGNFKEDRRQSNGTITQSITSKMIFFFFFSLRLSILHYCISASTLTTVAVHVLSTHCEEKA